MLALPGELDDAIGCLKAAGLEAVFASYTAAVARCQPWLSDKFLLPRQTRGSARGNHFLPGPGPRPVSNSLTLTLRP
jgi:hypothetical protein